MRTARGTVAGMALWAGGLASFLAPETRAESQLDASLPVARICVYGTLDGAGVVGGNAPIRCEPSAGAVPSSSRPADPASNPVGIVPQGATLAPGHERVWEDGRVNPGRGVPRPVAGPVVLGVRVLDPVALP